MKNKIISFETICLFIILLFSFLFIISYMTPVIGGADQNGYLVSARILQLENRLSIIPEDEYSFIGHHWVLTDNNRYYAKHPPFFPFITGMVMKLFGMEAGFYVNLICSLSCIVGIFMLFRLFFPHSYALAGSLILATNPIFNRMAIDQWSHPSSLCFLIWGYVFHFQGIFSKNERRTPLLFVISGLLLGYSSGIRYTNVILLIPLMILPSTGFYRLTKGKLFSFIIGLAIPIAILMFFHWSVYGGPLTTGYSLVGEQTAFTWQNFTGNIMRYFTTFLNHGIGPLFILAWLGLIMYFFKDKRLALFFCLWILPLVLTYASYYWLPLMPESILRFILPIFVPFILLALFFLYAVFHDHNRRNVILIAFLLCQVGWGSLMTISSIEKHACYLRTMRHTIDYIRKQIPSSASIFVDKAIIPAIDIHRDYSLYPLELLDQREFYNYIQANLSISLSTIQRKRVMMAKERFYNRNAEDYYAMLSSHLSSLLEKKEKPVYLVGTQLDLATLAKKFNNRFIFTQISEMSGELPSSRFPLSKAFNKASIKDRIISRLLSTEIVAVLPSQNTETQILF